LVSFLTQRPTTPEQEQVLAVAAGSKAVIQPNVSP
jgi:hypothetical protein